MAEEKKIKNGTSFWWQKTESKKNLRKNRFRKLESAKKLLEGLRGSA